MKLPQADDVVKISDIPLAVANGTGTPETLAKRYRFDRRQGRYYLQAAEMLSLVVRGRNRYLLSALGRRYVAFEPQDRRDMLAYQMLSVPIMTILIIELLTRPSHKLSQKEIERVVSEHSRISATTLARRVGTILKWFSWLGDETGSLKVTRGFLALRLR